MGVTSLTRTWVAAFRGEGPDTELDRLLTRQPGYRYMETASATAGLTLTVLKTLVRPPFTWFGETMIELSRTLRRAALPTAFASLVYTLAFSAVLFGDLVYTLGAGDRVVAGTYVGLWRELSTWLTFMVLAGIVGSATAGDLGARRVREELDALDVLGVDRARTLVVPRIVAITIAGVVLSSLVVLINTVWLIFLTEGTLHQQPGPNWEGVTLSMGPHDVFAGLIKHTILGFFIGIVACQKGLSARGGAEGVGRAVNETVVITFFGIWLINSLFNLGYLTVFPDALGLRG